MQGKKTAMAVLTDNKTYYKILVIKTMGLTLLQIYLFLFFNCCSSTVVSIFPPQLSPNPPTPTLNISFLWLCPWVLYMCSMMSLSLLQELYQCIRMESQGTDSIYIRNDIVNQAKKLNCQGMVLSR